MVIIGILSCCLPTVSAIETPIDLGTLSYQDYEYITISSDHEINIDFIYTDLNETDLLVEKIEFYPSTNETKYRFTSQEITPDFWFVPGTYDYIYQDIASGQLYTVSVDYASVVPPDNPYEVLYDALTLDYGYLNTSYNNLSTTYINTNESYNLLSQDMINLSSEHNTTIDLLDDKTTEFNNILQAHINLTQHFNNFNDTYNATMAENEMWILRVGNLNKYNDTFYKNMNSGYESTFYFNGREWTTPAGYEQQIQGLKGDIGLIPLYVILFSCITALVAWVIYKKQINKQIPSPLELERDIGYSPESNKIDRFVNGTKNTYKNIKDKVFPSIEKQADSDNGGDVPETTPKNEQGEKIDAKKMCTALNQDQIETYIEKIKADLTEEEKEKLDEIISKKENA